MQKSDFFYELPSSLIAQHPLTPRSASRLLHLRRGDGLYRDAAFGDLPDLLRPDDLLVFNDTRVIPARLHGRKDSGGRIEILVERVIADDTVLAQIRASKTPKLGQWLLFDDAVRAQVGPRVDEFFTLRFAGARDALAVLAAIGHMPLPPYIARPDSEADRERYQTVFARTPGAVAAPTAGLHFDNALFARLAARGIAHAFITLHVGAGTFQPLRTDDVGAHRMHREFLRVDAAVCAQIRAARARGGRVVAIGTTVVRALETAAATGEIRPYAGETDIFIVPGYRFRAVDALVTNFHLPESTLLMLVCALAGTAPTLAAYRHAVAAQYRFFSYGDAMFIE